MSFDIRKLTSEELSEHYSNCVQKRATAEAEAFYLNETRKRLLDTLTLANMDDDPSLSHAKALSLARASKEFGIHLDGQRVAFEERWQAYGDYHECDFEIKRRLNANFSKNMERHNNKMIT